MVDTSWTVDDGVSTYTIDGVSIDSGWPDFQVAQEVELTFLFNGQNHLSRYETFMDTFNLRMVEGLSVTGRDFKTQPYYSITQKPSDTSKSYLWKLTPSDRIDGVEPWWVVVKSIEDETRVAGAGERVSIVLFTLAPASAATRGEIKRRYEVEL